MHCVKPVWSIWTHADHSSLKLWWNQQKAPHGKRGSIKSTRQNLPYWISHTGGCEEGAFKRQWPMQTSGTCKERWGTNCQSRVKGLTIWRKYYVGLQRSIPVCMTAVTFNLLDEQPLAQSIKWILIFPRALIKDLSINDPIPHLMILKDLSAAFWLDSQHNTQQLQGHAYSTITYMIHTLNKKNYIIYCLLFFFFYQTKTGWFRVKTSKV